MPFEQLNKKKNFIFFFYGKNERDLYNKDLVLYI